MSAEWTRSIGFVCGPQRLFFCFVFFFFYFIFCCLQVGGVWRDNLPLGRHGRLSSIRVLFLLTWTPLGFSPFPRHGPTSFLLLFNSVSLFHFFLSIFLFIFSLFTAVYFCNGNIDPPSQRPINQKFSSTGERRENGPTRWFSLFHTS